MDTDLRITNCLTFKTARANVGFLEFCWGRAAGSPVDLQVWDPARPQRGAGRRRAVGAAGAGQRGWGRACTRVRVQGL